jgi:CO dehydrogenase/acetyl-CoA synthase beta subunit
LDLFDDTILEIKDWFESKNKTGQSRSYLIPPSGDRFFHPGEGNAGRIVLKEDTQVELGHPSLGSCSAALATRRLDLVSDNTITLVGPEICETRESVLPFAQIIIAALESSPEDEGSAQTILEIEKMSLAMDQTAHRCAPTEGYMIRSVPNLIWARISREAFRSGFSLQRLGERLIAAIKHHCPRVAACEVFFVTSTKSEVGLLDDLIEKARVKQRKLETYAIASDGGLECTQGIDCNSCSEQVVCDTIRDVIKIRKGDHLVRIKGDSDGADRTS